MFSHFLLKICPLLQFRVSRLILLNSMACDAFKYKFSLDKRRDLTSVSFSPFGADSVCLPVRKFMRMPRGMWGVDAKAGLIPSATHEGARFKP